MQSDRPFMESNLVAYGSKETIEETILKYILIKKLNVLIIFGRSNLNNFYLGNFFFFFFFFIYPCWAIMVVSVISDSFILSCCKLIVQCYFLV